MALKGKVLQEFFVSPKPINTDAQSENTSNALTDEKLLVENKPHSHFRIFDDPTKQTDKNLGQSYDKARQEPKTNLGQSLPKLDTNLGQEKKQKVQTQDKVRPQPRTLHRTNLGQSSVKNVSLVTFSSLVGLQREIVLLVYEQCNLSRDKVTPPLSIEHIANSCKTTRLSAQKTLQRLEAKKIIIRYEYKNGRGGWTRYEMPDVIFQEILHSETSNKLRTNLGQSYDKIRSEPKTELRTSASSSSSSFKENKTTTTGESSNDSKLANEWLNINIEPLSEFGFTQTHLIQIAQQEKLSPEVVQASIFAFAFDLRRNEKSKTLKTNPLNYFMGIVRNGQPYAPPSNYESPEEEAMRLYVEKQQILEQKRAELEKAAFELAFKEWLTTLSEDTRNTILSPITRNIKAEQPKLAELKSYFMKEIWINKRQEIMQPIT